MDGITIRKNGKAEIAYVGETPWHGYGDKLERGAPLEVWVVASGMNFSIQRSMVRYAVTRDADVRAEYITIPDRHVLFRSDNKEHLGIVSDGFKVVQPIEILKNLSDLAKSVGFELETAGTLFGGRRFWALASIGEDCEIVPGDKVGGYLLLCTAADGTMNTIGQFTTVRVVCHNTMSMAVANSVGAYKVSHKTVFDHLKMRDHLGIAHEEFRVFSDNMRHLADKTVSNERAERLIFELLKPESFDTFDAEKKVKTIDKVSNSKGFRTIMALFEGGGKGSAMEGVAGTAWGFVNAVTEYTDFHTRAHNQENRLNSAWFGAGNEMKEKAVDLALSL
jgi:phage/plasmid-like protein (TIGR03299 family)